VTRPVFVFLFACLIVSAPVRADWQQQLSLPAPGGFPPPRAMNASYRGGWSGLTAAQIEVVYSRPDADAVQLSAKASTSGMARTLWRVDATQTARADVKTLRPSKMRQVENYHAQVIRTNLDFDETGVTKFRESKPEDKTPPRLKHFDYPNLFDLNTALLFIRSQKLQTGQTLSIVVYPATSPYLATVRVLGREKTKVRAGVFPAIKLDLKLQKINKDFVAEPYTKFRRATAWISDDADRIPVKIAAEIFVGSVWVELERARFGTR
jgi:hypothetical protein